MRFYLRNDCHGRLGVYYICWVKDGRTFRTSARTRDHDAAQKALAQHILEHGNPRNERLDDVTVEEIVLRYWQHVGRTRASRDPVKQALAKVSKHLPMVTIETYLDSGQGAFLKALADEGLAASTITRYVGVIRTALNLSARNKEIPRTDPLLLPEREEEAGVPPFTRDEMRRVMEACESEGDRLFILICVATACRPHQSLDLTWDRVGTHAIDFRVPGKRLSKKRRAVAPLAPTVAAYLAARRSTGPVVRSEKHTKVSRGITTWKSKLKRICRRAKLHGSGYRIRKHTADYLANHGVPYSQIATLLGHRIPEGGKETFRYALHNARFMHETREAIEAMLRELAPSWLALAGNWPVANHNQLNSKAVGSDSWIGYVPENDDKF